MNHSDLQVCTEEVKKVCIEKLLLNVKKLKVKQNMTNTTERSMVQQSKTEFNIFSHGQFSDILPSINQHSTSAPNTERNVAAIGRYPFPNRLKLNVLK